MYHKIVSLKLKSVIFSQNYWQELSKTGGVSKSMLKKSRLDFDKIEKCE